MKFDGSVFSSAGSPPVPPTLSGFASFLTSLPEAVSEERVARNPIVSAGFLPSGDTLVRQRSAVHRQIKYTRDAIYQHFLLEMMLV